MPQFINSPYSTSPADGGVGSMLTQMGQSYFGDTAKRALVTQEMLKAKRENDAAQAGADAFRSNNPVELGAQSYLGGRSAGDMLGYRTGMAADNAGNDIRNPALTTALTAEGHYPQSPVSQDSAQANLMAQKQMEIASKPATMIGPDGHIHFVNPLQQEAAVKQGYRPLLSSDQNVSMMLDGMGNQQPSATPQQPNMSQPAGPGNSNAFGSNETIVPSGAGAPQQVAQSGQPQPVAPPPPITGDSSSQHFSPASLPPQTKPVPQLIAQPPAAVGPQQVTPQQPALVNGRNEAWLAQQPPLVQSLIKAHVNGEDISGRTAGLPPAMQLLVQNGSRIYEPTFDENKHVARRNTTAAYAPGGPIGQNVTSMGMAISHLNNFDQAVESLHNHTLAPGLTNWFHNQYGANFNPTYQDNLAYAKSLAEGLSEELPRTFRGASGAEADVIRRLGTLDVEHASPVALHGFAHGIAGMIGSRADIVQRNYDRTMLPPGAPSVPQLDPEAEAALTRLRSRGAPEQQGGGPARITDDAGYAALPSGAKYTAPDGSVRTKR